MKVAFYEGYHKAPSQKKRSPVAKRKKKFGGGSKAQTSKFADAVQFCKKPENRKGKKFKGCMSSEMKK